METLGRDPPPSDSRTSNLVMMMPMVERLELTQNAHAKTEAELELELEGVEYPAAQAAKG